MRRMVGEAKPKRQPKAQAKGGDEGEKLIVKNRRAYFEYEVLDQYEAGIALTGTEVKSLRDGNIQLGDAYARFVRGELFLVNANIAPYKMGGYTNHEPTRPRKLLLHKREIARLSSRVEEKGLTLVPLAVYWKRGLAKVRLGVCRGKKLYDKREAIAKRDAARHAARERE
jgi:SsrA-binding protein